MDFVLRKYSSRGHSCAMGPGRKPKSESGAAAPMTFRLSPDVRQRLRAAARELGLTQGQVVEMGVEAAEAEVLKKRTAIMGSSVGKRRKKVAK